MQHSMHPLSPEQEIELARLPKSRLIVLPDGDDDRLRIIGQTRQPPDRPDFWWETQQAWRLSIPELYKLIEQLETQIK